MEMMKAYRQDRFGLFTHFAGSVRDSDGNPAESFKQAARDFDVKAYAAAAQKMGVQYVVFTAWYAHVQPLYPSEVTKRWRPGNDAERDMIGDLIDALNAVGIHVVLYTHPRDGHDFSPYDRELSGWGQGYDPTVPHCPNDTPDFNNFQYEKWNRYMLEMYEELIDRYGDRINGMWLDGMGPGRFGYGFRGSEPYKYPIINYHDLRQIVKKKNPNIAMIQNMCGDQYNTDFPMPEMYYGAQNDIPMEDWVVCEEAMAMTPFWGGYFHMGKKGKSAVNLDPKSVFRFVVLQGTSTTAGGTCLAASPYRFGDFDVDVVETMAFYGDMFKKMGESFHEIIPSLSWPTVSGDSLNSKNFICACTSEDHAHEYIHILKMPKDGVIRFPKSLDGVKLSRPRVLLGNAAVADWSLDESGLTVKLTGASDEEMDTVLRFDRINNADAMTAYWLNDNNHRRIIYNGEWNYNCLCGSMMWCRGYFEFDEHATERDGDWMAFSYNDDIVEIYGPKGPNRGKADVLIDGMKVGEIDEYDEKESGRQLLFTTKYQYGGYHMLKLIKTGGESFSFDAARMLKYPD